MTLAAVRNCCQSATHRASSGWSLSVGGFRGVIAPNAGCPAAAVVSELPIDAACGPDDEDRRNNAGREKPASRHPGNSSGVDCRGVDGMNWLAVRSFLFFCFEAARCRERRDDHGAFSGQYINKVMFYRRRDYNRHD